MIATTAASALPAIEIVASPRACSPAVAAQQAEALAQAADGLLNHRHDASQSAAAHLHQECWRGLAR